MSQAREREPLKLMVEGEHRDQTVRERRFAEGTECDPMHARSLGIADVNGHKVRRTVTVGQDELLCLNDHDQLAVSSREYLVLESAGDYHCTCGEHFDGPEEAREHLMSAKDGS